MKRNNILVTVLFVIALALPVTVIALSVFGYRLVVHQHLLLAIIPTAVFLL